MKKYFLAFTIIPLVEIAILISLSDIVGAWTTIAIVVATAIIGTSLIKSSGKEVMENLQKAMMLQGDITDAILDGAILLVTGVLLITPGFFTDIFGLMIHIPIFKKLLKKYLIRKFKDKLKTVDMNTGFDSGFKGGFDTGFSSGFASFTKENDFNDEKFSDNLDVNKNKIIDAKETQDDYYL